ARLPRSSRAAFVGLRLVLAEYRNDGAGADDVGDLVSPLAFGGLERQLDGRMQVAAVVFLDVHQLIRDQLGPGRPVRIVSDDRGRLVFQGGLLLAALPALQKCRERVLGQLLVQRDRPGRAAAAAGEQKTDRSEQPTEKSRPSPPRAR